MATYRSRTNPVAAPSTPAGQFTFTAGTCSPATYAEGKYVLTDTGQDVTYTPSSTRVWRSDPTKSHTRNWKKIVQSGEISMTELNVGRETTEQFVVSRPGLIPYNPWRWGYCATGNQYQTREFGERYSTWTQNDHLGSLSNLSYQTTSTGVLSDFEEQIASVVASTQSAAFASSLSSYDVLTELAESRETLTFLRSKVEEAADAIRKFAHADEKTHRIARTLTSKELRRHADRAFRRYGSRWMELRYALMPIIYSMKDVNEMLGQRNAVYKTDRSRDRVEVNQTPPLSFPSAEFLYVTASLKADVKSTVKSAYNRGALQRILALSSFNPFKTAWEMLPLSFVVDWLWNIGDVITSQTSIDLSSQKVSCTSIKRTMIVETRLYDGAVREWPLTRPPAVYQGTPIPYKYTQIRGTDALLQTVSTESYERFLWSTPKPELTFNPYLNWKRFVDSLVLGYQPTKKLLRSL